jgi:hypothetical protein
MITQDTVLVQLTVLPSAFRALHRHRVAVDLRWGRAGTKPSTYRVGGTYGGAASARATDPAGDQGTAGDRRPRQLERPREESTASSPTNSSSTTGPQSSFIRVTADAKVLRDWFHDADTVYHDMKREVIFFGEMT